MTKENYKELKKLALESGATLFGVSKLDWKNTGYCELSPDTIKDLDYGISLAVRLSDKILEDITDHPTKLYLHHYKQVNYLLDRLALQLTKAIQEKGYSALPIPASQIVDWEKQKGHLSHRHLAVNAGLGWFGRNNLLVTPEFGARVRLVSVLTNIPLSSDKPLDEDCGTCEKCISACPSSAIKETRAEFNHQSCYKQLDYFRKNNAISQHICGICVKACTPKLQTTK